MEYGLQLYSVRDAMPKNVEETLAKVAGMGYKYVEFAGFFDTSAIKIKEILEKYTLIVIGTHTGTEEIYKYFDDTIAFQTAIGNLNVIIPGADLSNQRKIDDFVEFANKYQPLLESKGLRLGYHNHSFEFEKNADGSEIYKQLIERTNLLLELDIYWAFNAGQNPVALMERLAPRIFAIHIKDGLMGGEGKPLGQGKAPVRECFEKAREMGFTLIVESETLKPDGLSEAKICIDYLKGLE